jgi:hypothetical protein
MHAETLFGRFACTGGRSDRARRDLGGSCRAVWREPLSFALLDRETGSISPAKFGGYKGYALAAHERLVRQLVAEQPDITLAELSNFANPTPLFFTSCNRLLTPFQYARC